MFQKKKIILSYDYELFFGDRSGTVLRSLIEPTNLLLDAMDSVSFKGNFFVDWQMLKYLKEANTERTLADHQLIIDQLKDMVYRGHRIELHIHPHWVDAKYNGDGTWDFSEFRHYSLNSFSEKEIVDMFVEGTNLLTNIAREVDSEYKIVAFRAGGWAVQPFDCLKRAFKEAGIKIDSSVARGAFGKNKYSYFNFVDSPDGEMWRYENDVIIPDDKGEFIEVPISSYRRTIVYKGLDWLNKKVFNNLKCITDGTHIRGDYQEEPKPDNYVNYSRYTLSQRSILSILLAFFVNDKDLITYIDHPKDLSLSALRAIKILSKYSNTVMYKSLL